MCMSSPPTPPAPPAPTPPPATPKSTDPEVRQAKKSARRTAALAQGRSSTLLGGGLVSQPANQPKKTLLGQ